MPSPIPNADTQPPTARMTARRRRRAPELLAPAGDAAALTAALKAGCDAAYVGAKSFSMRGAAGNFTLSALRRAADQCHSRQARLYVAVNTIVYDGEQRAMLRLLDRLAGVADAVICWDPAVIAGCRERGIPIHISTQASVASTAAARFYRDLGAERVVLARECTLADVRAIGRRAGIGVEVFAHGAMCVSISGRCFLSQLSEGSSGNRGLCRQTCRRPFRVICQDGPADFEVFPGDSHVFSARDLCTLPFLDQLLEARPVSLKIEGRNRPADYVDTVIRAYRESDAHEAAAIWNEVVEAGQAFPQEELLTDASGDAFFKSQSRTAVAVDTDTDCLVGLYILHPNNVGRCGHICNASYAVLASERGRHIGEALVLDCRAEARKLGFRILQFNAVVRTNLPALRLYEKLGFVQLGVIPGGFRAKDGHYEDIIPHYCTL